MSNRYLVIENGVVANIVLSSPEYAQEQGWVSDPQYVDNQAVSIGWLFNNDQLSPPLVVEQPVITPAVPTKEELLKKLEELQNQIMELSAT
jgi:hypothetical protein